MAVTTTASTAVAFTPSWGSRLAGMEGLRALAALAVATVHTHDFLTGGLAWGPVGAAAGVALNGLMLFFALSGFLLYRPFATALLDAAAPPRIGAYAVNRVLRIYPAYLVVLLLVSVVLGVANRIPFSIDGADRGPLIGRTTDPLVLVTDATLLHTLFPFSMRTGLEVSWSLTVELVFYAVMPLMALAALRWRPGIARGRHAWIRAFVPVVTLLAIGVAAKVVKYLLFAGLPEDSDFYHHWGANWYAVLARSFPVHADLFAFGMAAAVLVAAFESGLVKPRLLRVFRGTATGIALFALLAAFILPTMLRDTAVAAASGGLILVVATPASTRGPGILARALEAWPLRSAGLVSYSFYLWHLPVIWFVGMHGWAGPPTWAGFARDLVVVLTVSLALAAATYLLVERPALRLKRRTDARAGALASG